MNDIDFSMVGKRIESLRGKLSREKLAASLAIHPQTLRNYEMGREPPVSVLVAVARHFHVTLDWLLSGESPATSGALASRRTLLPETVALAAVPAIRSYAAREGICDTDLEARILRAMVDYLSGIPVTDAVLRDHAAMENMVGLAANIVRGQRSNA